MMRGTVPVWYPLTRPVLELNHPVGRYKGNTYNIPMDIWVSENYPVVPPTCFVTPTHGTVKRPPVNGIRIRVRASDVMRGCVAGSGDMTVLLTLNASRVSVFDITLIDRRLADMLVRPGHRNVGADGMCYLPFLTEVTWGLGWGSSPRTTLTLTLRPLEY